MSDANAEEIRGTSIVSLSDNHFRADHDGMTIIMSVAAGKFFSFDRIGFDIWDRIGSPIEVDALAADLAKTYNASPDVVMPDLLLFLRKLQENELLNVG